MSLFVPRAEEAGQEDEGDRVDRREARWTSCLVLLMGRQQKKVAMLGLHHETTFVKTEEVGRHKTIDKVETEARPVGGSNLIHWLELTTIVSH